MTKMLTFNLAQPSIFGYQLQKRVEILKVFIAILFAFTISVSGFSQYQIDWRNAPLNPIPVKYTLSHFQFTGPVKKAVIDNLLGKQVLFFNSFGKLDSSITDDFLGHEKKIFKYDSIGNLINIISRKKYGPQVSNLVSFDNGGHLIQLNRINYNYNQSGYLISVSGDESFIQYDYNKENQLAKKEVFDIDNQLELTVHYHYKQYVNYIRIKENRVRGNDQGDNIWTYEYDSLGHLFYETNIYDSNGNYLGSSPKKAEAILEYF